LEACALRIALQLDGTVLPIQGPPGTGKTWTAAKLILALVRAGRRVGVTAMSHAVIDNLVRRVVALAASEGTPLRALLKAEPPDPHPAITYTASADEAEARVRHVDLLGATAWQWAREGMAASVDVLVIDEAGQMCLADAISVIHAAASLVLVGDPQQLEQPIQGTHPDGVGVSVLQHVLGEAQTIAPERGLFLDATHRLHPTICAYISEQFYEGRLVPGPHAARQGLTTAPLPAPGLYYLPVTHRGNQNHSDEEAAAVADLIARCLAGGTWTDDRGTSHPLTASDVLVVAPYNAHVAALRAALATRGLAAVPVGTVDKFQGREAVISIYSMATSLPEDAPRGLGFLYDRHRLDVATSRGRCATVLVASPALLRPICNTPVHLQLASGLARFVELAHQI
nr:AAA family ATPase [Deltaproteobacteria bacterium]